MDSEGRTVDGVKVLPQRSKKALQQITRKSKAKSGNGVHGIDNEGWFRGKGRHKLRRAGKEKTVGWVPPIPPKLADELMSNHGPFRQKVKYPLTVKQTPSTVSSRPSHMP
ncbi:hypothetical protein CJ030_MR3G026376 [Morella rubra]|uniref:Uncharacterized protein n=1 Tax=Morella rubra TaxID=262757 RepID=A0A6A1W2D2_9ROSI|nr:hypothetical protein CJ030_MR3G026376 [Morella rubra]